MAMRLGDIVSLPSEFNVKTYGAIGNGIANDTAAIQAAITAAITATQQNISWVSTAIFSGD